MSVHVFLHDDYADWELGYVLPELVTPSPAVPKRTRRVTTFSVNGEPVRSMGSLVVTPSLGLDRVDAGEVEALILPGGLFWESFREPRLDTLVNALVGRGVWVAGICAATGYLGGLGLLDGRDHTSNDLAFLQARAPAYAGAHRYKDALAVADAGVITASGLGAVEFTRAIIDALEVYDATIGDVWYRAYKHGENPWAKAPRK